ncbi:MAG: hypothetical protein IKI50_08030 [Clostridia bacterium]|nr:hypothetical protein [Clostridia bacterium]
MKKQLFDFRLYREHLRQLRVIGIIGVILFSLFGIISVISSGSLPPFYDVTNLSPESLSLLKMLPWPLYFCIFAPLITLFAFSFLNKRATSDFYHSIPQTRTCLFFAVFAAALTWVTVTLLGSALAASVTTLFFPRTLLLHTSSIPVILFTIWTGCLFVMAAVALAMSITGSFFSNVPVALMIIFVPRMVTGMFSSAIAEALPILSSGHLIPWLPSFENTSTAVVMRIFTDFDFSTSSYLSWTNGVYTLMVSLLLLAAGLWLFRKRRSEMAGAAAPNRILQTIYRLVLCGTPCILVCCHIFTHVIHGRGLDVISIVAAYLVILVVYFLYELITTRKVRNLLRAIPALGFLVLINVGALLGLRLMYNRALAFEPAAEEISSVRIVNENPDDYFAARCSAISFDDEALRQMVARRLQATNDIFRRQSGENAVSEYYSSVYNQGQTAQTVAIRCGINSYYRTILLTQDDVQLLTDCVARSEEYHSLYTDLPEKVDYIDCSNNNYIIRSDLQQVYQAMRQEVKNVPFETWYNLLNGKYYNPEKTIDRLLVRTTVDGVLYRLELPVILDMPQTATLFVEQMLNPELQESLLQDLQRLIDVDYTETETDIYFSYFPTDDPNGYSGSYSGFRPDRARIEKLISYLREKSEKKVDIGRLHLVFVNVRSYNYDKNDFLISDYWNVPFLLSDGTTYEDYVFDRQE